MTGQPFIPAVLGATIELDAAFGADLSHADGTGWVYADITTDSAHTDTVTNTIGRADNVGTAPPAHTTGTLNNPTGDYTAFNPVGSHYPSVALNTPIRRMINGIVRAQCYADAWNPSTDTSGKVKQVKLSAFGYLERLDGRKKPLRSAMYRSLVTLGPVAYWPMEDGPSTVNAASAVPGVAPLRPATAFDFHGDIISSAVVAYAAGGNPPGSGPLPDLTSGGRLTAALPVTGNATPWRMEMSFRIPSMAGGFLALMHIAAAGDVGIWRIAASSGVGLNVSYDRADGAVTPPQVGTNIFIDDNLWHRLAFTAAPSGSDIVITMVMDGVTVFTHTFTALAFGRATSVDINPGNGLSDAAVGSIGHVALWSPIPGGLNTYPAHLGFSGETVLARLVRLCAEESIPLLVTGAASDTMGAQSIGTILDLIRECESVDHGILYDGLTVGLRYRTRSSMYNQSTKLILDMSSGHVAAGFAPTFDKQATTNLVTVTRKGGSSATVEQISGPKGTATIGVEDSAPTINVDTDGVLPAHAGWLLGLGIVEGYRYPTLQTNLRAIPSKVAAILALTPGDRITIQHPASASTDLPPDDIDLIVEGWTETTTVDSWMITYNCSPYAPFQVAQVDDDTRVAADGTLAGPLSSTFVGSRTVNVPILWTTNAADFPLDVLIAGERITLSNITGTTSPQTFVISARSVNGSVKAQAAGAPVTVARPAVVAL